MSEIERSGSFPFGQARKIVDDLLVPRPLVYWADFLIHFTLGWGTLSSPSDWTRSGQRS